jgi:ferric-dicitrate binding protein FerR (iron transport regulator)
MPRPSVCDDARATLSDLLARTARSADESDLEAHLGSCPACYGHAVEMFRQDRALRELAGHARTPAILARFRQEVHAAPAPSSRRVHVPSRKGPALAAAAVISAAAVLLILTAGRGSTPAEISPPSRAPVAGSPTRALPPVAPSPVPISSEVPALTKEKPAPAAAVENSPVEKPAAAGPKERKAPHSVLSPAPDPALALSRSPALERKTVAVGLFLEKLEGEVYVLPAKEKMKAGGVLLPGQGLETRGSRSRVLGRYADQTRVELAPDTAVELLTRGESVRLSIARGSLRAKVSPQPQERPMTIETPHGEVRVLGTEFVVRCRVEATEVEVIEGKVRVTPKEGGEPVEVLSGFYVVAAPGTPLFLRPVQDKGGRKPLAAAGHPGVDQKRVDEAIRKGLEVLQAMKNISSDGKARCVELVLLTYVTGGVPESDPRFQELLKEMLEEPLALTYNVALQAMVLEELDRVKYQPRLYQCAQFLVDNQNAQGSWRYGEPTNLPKDVPTGAPEKKEEVPTGRLARPGPPPPPGTRVKPPVRNRIPVKQMRVAADDFDNSNSQYAALGLRACHDAGIIFPRELVEKARTYWINGLTDDDGGKPRKGSSKDTPTGGSAEIRGWGYRPNGSNTGSMTAGGIGAVCIYDYMLGRPWKSDPDVLAAMNWLAKHFTVKENPPGKEHHFYYLYALERAGMLYETDKFGPFDWYREGAHHLLSAQQGDGSWKSDGRSVVDTCFAILFLKRATRTFFDVPSVDRNPKR